MASVRERVSSDGQPTWQVLYRHGVRQTSKTFPDAKTAQRFKLVLDQFPGETDKAIRIWNESQGTAADDRLTVAQLAARFLEWKSRPGEVTLRTLNDYRRDVANWILPWFGHRAAEALDEADVQAWVDHMAAKPLAPKTVGDKHMLLHQMYDFGKARSRRLVTHNPCTETELPRAGKRPPKGTTVPQWRAIMAAAHDRAAYDAEDLIRFLGTVGWRWSEGAALPVWAVEDRDPGHALGVWVDMRQVFRVVDNRQVLELDEAKTYAGFRRVQVLASDTTAMLRRRIVGKGSDDFVFTNSGGRHWNQQTFLRETWPTILGDAQLWKGPKKSPTPHWLRHMAVAVLAAAGVPPHEIQRYIGHRELSTTMGTYGGMLGGMTHDVAANVDAILSGRGEAGPVVVGEVLEQLRELG